MFHIPQVISVLHFPSETRSESNRPMPTLIFPTNRYSVDTCNISRLEVAKNLRDEVSVILEFSNKQKKKKRQFQITVSDMKGIN